jgi:hypothetical protein
MRIIRFARAKVERVADEAGRAKVVAVLRATYQEEKRWVSDPATQAPSTDLSDAGISWFVASIRGEPAGVVRVLYDPPLAQYAKYGLKPIDPALAIEDFIRRNRIAEIGRFAVVPKFRSQFMVAASLIRAAAGETVRRSYTHYVTDVFEDDPHSPLGFHTRVMGFRPVATHDTGELRCASRRITLVLDLKAAYLRLKARQGWLFRFLTWNWDAALHHRMAL